MKTNPTLAHQLTVLPAAMFSAAMLALSAPAQAQPGPPTVTLQTPTNLTVFAGSNVLIAASAGGVGPFSYQWQLSGTNLPDSIITTVAGNGKQGSSGDGGVATNAELFEPPGVAVDATGNLFIADGGNSRIRKVGTNGIISTVVGNGTRGYLGDGGVATNAELYDPQGVAVDATGDLFIADQYNQRIREVGTNGIITTVAGTGTEGYAGDGGAATNAEFYDPQGVALDATCNLFIADALNFRIRKVASNSNVLSPTLVLNNLGLGNAGAYDVVVSSPYGSVTSCIVNVTITIASVALQTPTNLTASAGSDVTLAVSAAGVGPFSYQWQLNGTNLPLNGIISTVAGDGTQSYSGDGGVATNAELNHPSGVAMDANGNLYGVASGGASQSCFDGCGVVFEITP